ncbi:MAG TPA: pyridoxamine 5'-phosphate oxidase [Vicinamibacterales bacterium]|jgi:pyridoxamine 5'-phosphate oxidase
MPVQDPIQAYQRAAESAAQRGVDVAPAMLATADAAGRPSARIVLIRGVDERGFVFYTNFGSRKARELHENPRAALCQHWPEIDEQIRVEGHVVVVAREESDRYFAGRPRESQIGAWASEQSADLASRETLETRYRDAERRFEGHDVTRPEFWGGYRVIPDRIEFWYGRPGRLHDRVLYARSGDEWTMGRLYP